MKSKTPIFVFAFTLAGLSLASSADKNTTYTDPAKVDADYAVQGEYVGTMEGEKAGGQVIALGDGKFDIVSYPGGLPGDGWDGDKSNRVKGTGETKDGVTTFTADKGVTIVIKGGKMTVSEEGKEIGTLARVVRESSTLGAKPPEGAVILFDGDKHGADLWKGGKVSEDGLLEQGCTSKQTFSDFKIHLEFRTPYKPMARGQGRGNSGFYAHGRYEVQILDSFGLEGEHNQCGGIYSTKPPLVNMCYPPLQWQTYDFDFTAAKFKDGKKVENAHVTILQNGVLIHDKTVCDHATTASPMKEGPEPGPVYFQNHGNPVRFRNVWVEPK
jgi:hypothetical protein